MTSIDDLSDRFAARAWVDDPFTGPALPADFAASSAVWPRDERWADVEIVKTITAGPRSVDELYYTPRDPDGKRVPVAIVWDDSGSDKVARVYYNKTFIGGPGSERVRPPVLRPEPDLDLHPTLVAYHAALSSADGPGIVATLAPGFRVRVPSGVYLEGDDVRTEFADRFAKTGGVPLQYVTATDDGVTAALEFISWRVPPHAGIGVYDRNDDGLISEFRAYEGPVLPKPGQSPGPR